MGVLDDAIREHLELKRKHGATDDEITRQSEEALGPPRRERPGAHEGDEPGDSATAVEATKPAPSEAAEAEVPGSDEDLFSDMPEREPGRGDTVVGSVPDEPEPADAGPVPAPVDERETAPPPGPVLPEQGGNGAHGSPAGADPIPDPEPAAPDPTAAPPETPGDPDATMLYESVGETPPDSEPSEPGPPPEPPGAPPPGAPSEPAPPGAPPEEETAADAGDEQPRDESEQQAAGEDVLEETPEFLQETPDDERLWFEQKPPRDFDFDD